MSRACWEDSEAGMPAVLRDFLSRVLVRVSTVVQHARRMTVIPNDVALVLKQMGM